MNKLGFTLIELMVVIGIVGIIMTFSSINLISTRNKASLNSTITQVVADLKQQQTKAMIGEVENGTPDLYGIHFDSNSYILFHGSNFNSTDPSNFLINLEPDLEFSASQNIYFKKGCGELAIINTPIKLCGDSTETASIIITNKSSNEPKQITINQFGVITEVKTL